MALLRRLLECNVTLACDSVLVHPRCSSHFSRLFIYGSAATVCSTFRTCTLYVQLHVRYVPNSTYVVSSALHTVSIRTCMLYSPILVEYYGTGTFSE